jgi:hypothetical protein
MFWFSSVHSGKFQDGTLKLATITALHILSNSLFNIIQSFYAIQSELNRTKMKRAREPEPPFRTTPSHFYHICVLKLHSRRFSPFRSFNKFHQEHSECIPCTSIHGTFPSQRNLLDSTVPRSLGDLHKSPRSFNSSLRPSRVQMCIFMLFPQIKRPGFTPIHT